MLRYCRKTLKKPKVGRVMRENTNINSTYLRGDQNDPQLNKCLRNSENQINLKITTNFAIQNKCLRNSENQK